MRKMSLEQMDHFLRHMKMHVIELKEGSFSKGPEYIEHLKNAQYMALEISHDIIHILRYNEFKGYEDADFCFDVGLPNNLNEHNFTEFEADSFKPGCRFKDALDLGIDESMISISVHELEEQMNILGHAIQDAGVFIKLLEDYFR